MKKSIIRWIVLFLMFAAFSFSSVAMAAETIQLGALFPFSGSLALQGRNQFRGLDIAREMRNERGGLWGKKIEFVRGDAVTPKKAMTECERLISVKGVRLVCGTYSSSRAYTASAVAEREHVIYWEGNAIADRLTTRGFKYLFRATVKGSDYGIAGIPFIEEVVAPELGKEPKEIQVATVFEDTLYGSVTSSAFVKEAVKHHFNVVGSFSYSAAKIQDFSPIILRLKTLDPDVLFVVPYVKDFILFWRQVKDLNLNVPVVLGGGTVGEAGVAEAFEENVDYVFNAYPPQYVDPDALLPEARTALEKFEERYAEKYGETPPPPLAITGFSAGWVLFEHVLPDAGSLNPEAVREAALELNIPEGGTPLAFGVKFAPPGHPHAGHNLAAFAIIQQYQDGGKRYVVWPEEYSVKDPMLPMPTWEERARE